MKDNKFLILSYSSNFKLDSTFSRCSKTNKRTNYCGKVQSRKLSSVSQVGYR